MSDYIIGGQKTPENCFYYRASKNPRKFYSGLVIIPVLIFGKVFLPVDNIFIGGQKLQKIRIDIITSLFSVVPPR